MGKDPDLWRLSLVTTGPAMPELPEAIEDEALSVSLFEIEDEATADALGWRVDVLFRAPPDAAAVAYELTGSGIVVEQATVERHFAGDRALFLAYRASCVAQFTNDLRQGDDACARADAPALRRLAHSLKSVLLTLGQPEASERARQLIDATEQVAALIRQPAPLNPLEVLAWPGVLVADAADPQALNAAALQLFEQALGELKSGRAREGAELAKLLNERLDNILEEVATLRALIPEMLGNQRQKIEARFAELQAELDPQRLEQELVLLAQKSDVAEELDRLSTHVTEVRRVLKAGGAAGRRLDFLMQELNREANTLGSKAFDPRSTQAAVNLKVLIEQMREQVQNIE